MNQERKIFRVDANHTGNITRINQMNGNTLMIQRFSVLYVVNMTL